MAETQREKLQRIGRAFRDAPDSMREGGFAPLEYADAVYGLLNNQQAPTAIDVRPKNFEVGTIPPAQPLMSPNNVVASSIDPNTGREFPAGQELDADNLMLAQLASPTTPDGTPKDPGKFASDMAARSTVVGLAGGRDNAEYNNQKSLLSDTANSISGLLGDFDFKGLLRVLARPEFVAPMGPGQSPITNFVNAAAADRTARADSSKENRKLAAKEAMEQFNRSMRQGELSVKQGNLAVAQERLDRPKSIEMTEANVKNIGNMVYDLFSKEIDDRVENDERTQRAFGIGSRDMSPQEAREAIQSSIAAQAIGLMQQDRDLNPAQAIAKVLGKGAPGVEQPENKDKHATVGG